MSEPYKIVCPCCGCVGAEPNAKGLVYDGQPLLCGCAGHVSCDVETAPYIWVSDTDPCPPWADCWTTEERREFWRARNAQFAPEGALILERIANAVAIAVYVDALEDADPPQQILDRLGWPR